MTSNCMFAGTPDIDSDPDDLADEEYYQALEGDGQRDALANQMWASRDYTEAEAAAIADAEAKEREAWAQYDQERAEADEAEEEDECPY